MPSTNPPSTPQSRSIYVSSTPFSKGSAKEEDGQPQTQRDLKDLMAKELDGATWELDDVLPKICPADPTVLGKVVKALKTKGRWPPSESLLEPRAVLDRAKRPIGTSLGERGHYQPLVDIFNAIKEAFQDASQTTGFYRNHVMMVYDKPTGDQIGEAAQLKPDLVIVAEWLSRLVWGDIDIPVEVKKNWKDMFKQALTYARAVFAKQDRYYVLCILYNFETGGARFCFCTRSGVISSPELSLKTEQGFSSFVAGIVGILSLPDMKAAGIQDEAETVQWLQSVTGATYSRTIRMMIRTAVRGRGTGADAYVRDSDSSTEAVGSREDEEELDKEITAESMLFPVAPPSPIRSRIIRSATRKMQEQLERSKQLNVKSSSAVASTSSKPSGKKAEGSEKDMVRSLARLTINDIPPCVVVKTSFPRQAEDREVQLFSQLKDMKALFGLPEVLEVERLAHPILDLFTGDTGRRLKYWSIFALTSSVVPLPEDRTCVRLALGTCGIPIQKVESPRQLVKCILHAMIGHANLVLLGWLHRDVSVGNILALEKAERRPPIARGQAFDWTECVGVIIDGDQALQWTRIPVSPPGARRSGTVPFISQRLLRFWDTPEETLQTPADDLESFAWVLVWVVLRRIETVGKLNADERIVLEGLCNSKLTSVVSAKSFLLQIIHEYKTNPLAPSVGLKPFVSLVTTWFSGVRDVQTEQQKTLQSPYPSEEARRTACLELFFKSYDRYFEAALTAMDSLPDTWDYIPGKAPAVPSASSPPATP